MNDHDILGVAPGASADELASAYRRQARRLHPDAHPGASVEQRARYDRAMARLNAAYRNLVVRPTPSGSQNGDGRTREPGAEECSMCGHAPAREMTFESQSGVGFSRHRLSQRMTLCRDCGRAVGRSHQDRTLRTGFWGPTLFVTNLGVVSRNARQLRRAGALGPPSRPATVRARISEPLSAGNPVPARVGFWVLPLVLVFALCVLVGLRGMRTGAAPALGTGACLTGTRAVAVVPCNSPHDEEIVARARRATDCPASADAFLEQDDGVLCVHLVS